MRPDCDSTHAALAGWQTGKLASTLGPLRANTRAGDSQFPTMFVLGEDVGNVLVSDVAVFFRGIGFGIGGDRSCAADENTHVGGFYSIGRSLTGIGLPVLQKLRFIRGKTVWTETDKIGSKDSVEESRICFASRFEPVVFDLLDEFGIAVKSGTGRMFRNGVGHVL